MGRDILLVDFNMLMNYDYAILATNRYVYDHENLLTPSNNTYKLLENRDNERVLSIDYPNLSDDELDIKLNELVNKYSDIIFQNLIINTNVFNVVNSCNHNIMIDVTVCCKDLTEQHIVKSIFGYKSILDEEVKVGEFDTFMIHKTSRLITNLDRYIGNSVYIAMTKYNLQLVGNQLVLPKDIIDITTDKISIKLISLFDNKKEEK